MTPQAFRVVMTEIPEGVLARTFINGEETWTRTFPNWAYAFETMAGQMSYMMDLAEQSKPAQTWRGE